MPSASAADRARLAPGLALMLASGFAGLGYQVVWTRQASLWLGSDPAAVLAVFSAFFGGLALGARTLGERIERGSRPGRAYAWCEVAIAAWGVVLMLVLEPVSALLLRAVGQSPSPAVQWGVAFLGTGALLLPATVAMGATLPAMQRALAGWPARRVAWLYAANTAGALAGVLATGFWLLPALGLRGTTAVCVGLNLACAVAARLAFDRAVPRADTPADMPADMPATAPVAAPLTAPVATSDAASSRRRGIALLAVTGMLGIAYEVLVLRVLGQHAENTVYTVVLALGVYLVGHAVGAAALPRRATTGGLLVAVGLACVASLACLGQARAVAAAATAAATGLGVEPMAAALAGEAAIAAVALLLPAAAMGALFASLSSRAVQDGHGWGRPLAWNTFGAALAPTLFGVALVPLAGVGGALLAVAAAYLVLAAVHGTRAGAGVGAAALAALVVLAPSPSAVGFPEGTRVLAAWESASAQVVVVEDEGGVRRLHIDHRAQEGASDTRWADRRQALLPMLLHPSPERALFLGLGTGLTAAAAGPLARVDVVELLPEVADAAAGWFLRPEERAGLNVRIGDARRVVRGTSERWDVIVADNFHPARGGSALLTTAEHFEAVRARLAEGGLFCQWLPLHQMDLATLRHVVAAFLQAFPQAHAVIATNSLQTPVVGLVARPQGGFDAAALRARLASLRATAEPAGLQDEWALLGSIVAGPAALARFAGDAAPNRDDRLVVAYTAPRTTYAPPSRPRDRLLDWLAELGVDEVEAATGLDPERLAAYRRARNAFLLAGREVPPIADPVAMLARIGGPMLAVVAASPDFRPAYDPLVALATAASERAPEAARRVLTELARLQPARPEASLALRRIDGAPTDGPRPGAAH
ncbi:MAG: fused MFS/spermidine synthase [Burkholderiales bacterium]